MAETAVVLVIPPSTFLLDDRVFPSLGILRVAAALEGQGQRVSVLDLSGISNYEDVVERYLSHRKATHVGITATTPQMPAALRIIKRVRQIAPGARVILGGPHTTLVTSARKLEEREGRRGRAHEAMAHLHTVSDVLVSGDGERAILVALAPDAPVFVDGDDHRGPLFMTDADYENSDLPARHLIDLTSYKYQIEGHAASSLIAQLGCPFQCGFCGGRNSKSLRMIRTRSSASIVAEIEELYRSYGFTGFMFYDDELNVNKEMLQLMEQLSAMQRRLGVEFRLRGFVKAELFTQQQAQAMHSAGFRWLLTGFESGAPQILENMNKKATREENSRAVEFARSAGLKVKALMSIGHPGESFETVAQTEAWLLQVRPDDFDCTIITTYPGTPYYDEAVPHAQMDGVYTYVVPRSGDRLHSIDVDFTNTADYYKGNPEGGYVSYVFTDTLSSEELVSARDNLERTVRRRLDIPFNTGRAAQAYEHSMGMGAILPSHILRSTSL
ncbi:MAG: radical SAM protein [bacterium]|nr:radical SAM protein [bacterium]